LKNIKFLDVLSIDYLEISTGKVTSIIGGSGAGKSTLAKLLNKMITPDSGKITYRGKDLTTYDPVKLRREVVMLSQTPLALKEQLKKIYKWGLSFQKSS